MCNRNCTYNSSYFEEKENSEVNAADHQDWDQELEESRESSVPSMRHMTQCKIEFTYASHCISKNLTPRKMLKKDLSTAKINRWNNSFQNMYDMLYAKWTIWPGKLFLSKKHLKTPKIMDNCSDRLTLEGAGGQTDHTRPTIRPP